MQLSPWSYADKTKTEFAEQAALFMWANMAARFGCDIANTPAAYTERGWAKESFHVVLSNQGYDPSLPALDFLFAIKNAGHGDAIRGALSRAEGVKAGVPDVMLPVPTNDYFRYHGLWIELKRRKSDRGKAGVIGVEQVKWHDFLTVAGYKVVTCEGWMAARDAILQYLGITPL